MEQHIPNLPLRRSQGISKEINDILTLLETVIDPETGINIVDMGLIYAILRDGSRVSLSMTMTSAACPMGDLLIKDVEDCLNKALSANTKIRVDLTFNPPWDPAMMSDSARAQFGW